MATSSRQRREGSSFRAPVKSSRRWLISRGSLALGLTRLDVVDEARIINMTAGEAEGRLRRLEDSQEWLRLTGACVDRRSPSAFLAAGQLLAQSRSEASCIIHSRGAEATPSFKGEAAHQSDFVFEEAKRGAVPDSCRRNEGSTPIFSCYQASSSI